MIKIVFFDIDGTLVSPSTKTVPESAKLAISKLKEKGILCFIATGRHPNNTKSLGLEELELDGMIGLNGQIAVDKNKHILFCEAMDQDDQANIVKAFNKRQYPMVIIEQDQQYFNYITDEIIEMRDKFKLPPATLGEYNGGEILQGIAYVNETDEASFMANFNNVKSARWNQAGFDIINKHGGKDKGIAKLIDILGIKQSETMAFGDNHNDKEMLQFVNIGVAMGNCIDDLAKTADYVTDTPDNDGIYNALKHFKII